MKQAAKLVGVIAVAVCIGLSAAPITLGAAGYHGGYNGGNGGWFHGGSSGGYHGGYSGGYHGGYWGGPWYPWAFSFSYYGAPYYYDYDYPPPVYYYPRPADYYSPSVVYSSPPPSPEVQNSQPVQHSSQGQPGSVSDIKALAKAGVSDTVILSQIRNSRTVYRLSTAEIIDLKTNNVSEAVIDFMINTSSRPDLSP
jgi:hypothetical protein